MDYLALVFRWMHVLSAVILGGGILFYRFCLVDPNRTSSLLDEQDSVRRRWMMLVGVCSLFLLLSGSYNFYTKLTQFRLGGMYHGLFGLKLLLGLASFYLASVLAGRSERAKRFRQREPYWATVLAVMIVITVLIGGAMKISSDVRIQDPAFKKVSAATAALDIEGN
jgi:hypothetical protein